MKKSLITLFIMLFMLFLFFSTTITKAHKSFNDYVILIDAGHGGYDGGAKGPNGSIEKDINLNIALYLFHYLRNAGFDIIMTRTSDIDFVTPGPGSKKKRDLDYRIKLINETDCDFFISIHVNSLRDTRWHGAQTFYYDRFSESERLAECIQDSLTNVLQNTNRKASIIRNLYLFKMVEKPGVLIEAGFLSNLYEESLLMQEKYQDLVAFAIYLGMIKCLEDV